MTPQVHLSASACLSRVKRLEAAGVLKRFVTEIDMEKLAPHVEAFAEITLENHTPEECQRFDDHVAAVAQITDSYKISGAYDYLLKFICKDVKAYNRISESLIEANIGIAKINTLIILHRTKDFSGFPLDDLVQL